MFFFHRFLLRAQVLPVSDDGLLEILSARTTLKEPDGSINSDNVGDLDELITDISASLDGISMEQSICVLIRDLRTFAREDLGVYISDRRLVKAARLLRVSAATNGRSRVDFVDCLLLQHMLWEIPEQREAVSSLENCVLPISFLYAKL